MPSFTLTTSHAGKIKLTLVAVSFSLMAAAALAAKSWLSAPIVSASAAAPAPPSIAATPTSPARLESEHITIRPTGFEPSEITRPMGRVLLAVNDRAGLGDVTLRLDVERGARLHEAHLPQGRHEWRQVVNLTPGRYLLTEAAHPEWVCRITITPN